MEMHVQGCGVNSAAEKVEERVNQHAMAMVLFDEVLPASLLKLD
jgi:hypothetical protein